MAEPDRSPAAADYLPVIVALLRHADQRPYVDPVTGAADRDPRTAGPSPADIAALETALRLAEQWHWPVLAVTAGPPAAAATLRLAAALGAATLRVDLSSRTEVHTGTDPEPLGTPHEYLEDLAHDERLLAQALVAAILQWLPSRFQRSGAPAVVVCGDRSSDRGTGALPAYVAAELAAAQALGLVEAEPVSASPTSGIRGQRRIDHGRREILAVPMPAVVSVEGGQRLRRASLGAELTAQRSVIPAVTRTELGLLPARETVRLRHAAALRPVTTPVAAPVGSPHERLLTLTGALVEHSRATVVHPANAGAAADALLSFLAEQGYALPDRPSAAGSAADPR